MSSPLVLDSWAVLSYLLEEPGGAQVGELLKTARRAERPHYLCVVNWGEVIYSLRRAGDEPEVQRALHTLDTLPIELVPADRELALRAAELKLGRRLGYADCFAAALAQERNTGVVTGDKEFKQVEDLVKVVWLS